MWERGRVSWLPGWRRWSKHVHVLDGSAAMLDVARKNLAQFENLEFHPADGLALPLPDASLDAVFANMYLHHCPDPLAAIREMVRILRPGGRLVITDMDTHPRMAQNRNGRCVAGLRAESNPRLVRAGGVGQRDRGLHRGILPGRLRKRRGGARGYQHLCRGRHQARAHARIGAGELRRPGVSVDPAPMVSRGAAAEIQAAAPRV